MAKRSQPNAQNSELNPKAHPSGARIQEMMKDSDAEKGERGETLRPSERENRYISPEEPAEGSRDDFNDR